MDFIATFPGLAFKMLARAAIGVGFILIALLGFTLLATAQEAGASAATVDFGPLATIAIEIVAPIVVTVLGGLATWVLAKVGKSTGLRIDSEHRSAIEQGLGRAVGYAITKLEDRAKGGIPINLRNEAIATASRYALESVPGALEHFGVTSDRLSEMIEARLEGLLIDPDAPAQAGTRPVSPARA